MNTSQDDKREAWLHSRLKQPLRPTPRQDWGYAIPSELSYMAWNGQTFISLFASVAHISCPQKILAVGEVAPEGILEADGWRLSVLNTTINQGNKSFFEG